MSDEIMEIVIEIIGCVDITKETNLLMEELIDSMEILRIIVELENRYNIKFDMFTIDMKSFCSVEEITKLVCEKLK